MLLVADVDLPSVRARGLVQSDRELLAPMIRRSDNDAAGRVLGIVGPDRLRGLAHRAGMRRFRPVTGIWGLSQIDAVDQARSFLRIDSLVALRHRAYAMKLLNTITPAQRWGSPAPAHLGGGSTSRALGLGHGLGRPPGRAPDPRRRAVSIAILTQSDGSHAYGKETVCGIAARLLRGLGSAEDVR